jgi:cobalt-zinc-cadmium efflux system membrane fusion protein
MMKHFGFLALLTAAIGGFSSSLSRAADGAFAVTDEQLARLGVTLGSAERVDLVAVAAGPAEVVVPPARQALVSAPLGGVVARLLVAEGDSVAAGQVLAELQSVEYLERQREYLDAAAAAELAAAQAERDRGLYEEGIIAERRQAESLAAARAARAQLDQARAQLELAGLGKDDLARLAARRELTTRIALTAPLTGVVTAAMARVGSRIDALDPVLAVADLTELWLELRLPQESATRVRPGMFTAVTANGATLMGAVTTVGGAVDAGTQTVLVRAVVDHGAGVLRAGQFLTARVLEQPDGGVAYAVPAAAVTRDGETAVLFVRSGDHVVAQQVTLLSEDGERIYVATGIGADSVVAIDGISALKALWRAAEEEGG